MQIADHTIVAIRYNMKNSRGEVLEDIMKGEPVSYLHGAGNILPVLESALAGLEPGGHTAIFLPRDPGGEGPDDDLYFEVTVASVRAATPEEVEHGGPALPGTYPLCGPDCQC
ncbi:hypothetical protein [Compostibacter hankyongensis]|uniref:Peptidylprolyl isomerase n=1 Tax=Compostibacter hankyongensis TaxID=1007089 RepID=A0ABP8FSY6_9BACT